MRRFDFLRVGAVALAGGIAGSLLTGEARPASAGTTIPNTPVVDHTGRELAFYDDLIRDRAVLLNFFYTACGDTCPLVTENLREVQDILRDRMGRDIFMVSVTLQPELETPPILRDYARLWDIRPGWSFVTGRPDRIAELRRATGFQDSEPDFAGERDSHTGMVRYGNDRLDRWGCAPGVQRPAWIAKAVTMLADMG
jgi:protein SCO1/2